MILVLLGTQNNSFHLLLEEIDRLIQDKVIKEEVIVQAGYTKYHSSNMQVLDFISNEMLEELQKKAIQQMDDKWKKEQPAVRAWLRPVAYRHRRH